MTNSNLLYLLRDNSRVLLLQLFLMVCFEVEVALVLLRVPVGGAVEVLAPAFDGRQTHLLLADPTSSYVLLKLAINTLVGIPAEVFILSPPR